MGGLVEYMKDKFRIPRARQRTREHSLLSKMEPSETHKEQYDEQHTEQHQIQPTTTPTVPFKLLALPTELRLMIYHNLFSATELPNRTALLRACQQTHSECLQILYSKTTIHLENPTLIVPHLTQLTHDVPLHLKIYITREYISGFPYRPIVRELRRKDVRSLTFELDCWQSQWSDWVDSGLVQSLRRARIAQQQEQGKEDAEEDEESLAGEQPQSEVEHGSQRTSQLPYVHVLAHQPLLTGYACGNFYADLWRRQSEAQGCEVEINGGNRNAMRGWVS